MRSARLELALQSGAFTPPPTGDIAVLRPRVGDDLAALPADQVAVLTGFKPDFDHFQRQGFRMETAAAAAAIVCLPRAKADAFALIAEAFALLPAGAPVLIDTTQFSYPFFEKFGFETTKITKDFYAAGMDRYDMVYEAK